MWIVDAPGPSVRPEVVGDNCNGRAKTLFERILGPTHSVRVTPLREGSMTFDNRELFSTQDPGCSERLAMTRLEPSLPYRL